MTTEEEIQIVHGGKRHVVILGAGATVASTLRDAEKNGLALPLMHNVVDILGLTSFVKGLPEEVRIHANDFEALFSELAERDDLADERALIEMKVYDYFSQLELPDAPTIYDYLILSLRYQKDVIATFNWDPFLFQAYARNQEFVKSPAIIFLHGNVAVGYDKQGKRGGPAGLFSPDTGQLFESTKLLYPVSQKDYNSDEFINRQWKLLQGKLSEAECVTIFGYSAPKTDVEAIGLLQTAWGNVDQRNMEQFEFIDIQDEDVLIDSWKSFVHTHHYFYSNSYFDSSLANHPRRTVESYHHWAMPMTPSEAFQEGNKIPDSFETLEELWEWHRLLVEAEDKFYNPK